jgi:hypothetical protein
MSEREKKREKTNLSGVEGKPRVTPNLLESLLIFYGKPTDFLQVVQNHHFLIINSFLKQMTTVMTPKEPKTKPFQMLTSY